MSFFSFTREPFDIVFVNPFDTRGGASIGTFRLFRYFQKFSCQKSRLLVVAKSSNDVDVESLPRFFSILLYFQAFLNKSFLRLSATAPLPVAFTFLTPLSLPALFIFLKSQNFKHLYLHSFNAAFGCPSSLYLLLNSASLIKTADDWYLTGGCHYSLNCSQWRTGCLACPHLNWFGQAIVRLNWQFKRFCLAKAQAVFISPSHWLSSRYQSIAGLKTDVIYNASEHVDPSSFHFAPELDLKLSLFNRRDLVLGIPVTYLSDIRKGFWDLLPVLSSLLNSLPVSLLLCGKDSCVYLDHLSPTLLYEQLSPSPLASLGALRKSQMHYFYTNCDLILHTSKYDNSPNVITEAFSFGVPCLVLDSAGSPEHVQRSGAGAVVSSFHEIFPFVEYLVSNKQYLSEISSKAYNYSLACLSERAMFKSYQQYLR